jgi:hypothetical protein
LIKLLRPPSLNLRHWVRHWCRRWGCVELEFHPQSCALPLKLEWPWGSQISISVTLLCFTVEVSIDKD